MQNQTQNQIAAKTNENHSYKPVGGFLPSLNKAGKVTATAEKRAALLNALDTKGVQALAVNGKGSMSSAAAAALGIDSLHSLLGSGYFLSGGQIATLRAMLIGTYGEALYNRENHKGLSGLVEYLALVAKKFELDQAAAETASTQSRIIKKLADVRAESAAVQRLIDLRDSAISSSAITDTTMAPKKATMAPKKATMAPKKATT